MTEHDAKKIRADREAKAKRLGSAGEPHQKVDASSWTPPEMMNTGAKTGLRPVSPRQYRHGGTVHGAAAHRADRKPRKTGGEATKYAEAKVNRNVKEANAELGKPHVGGMKKGGRAKKMDGGQMTDPRMAAQALMAAANRQANVTPNRMDFSGLRRGRMAQMAGLKKGGKVSHMEWEHSKADLEQDKKLAKKHGMSMEKWEKSALDAKHDKQQSTEGLKKGGVAGNYTGGTRPTGGRIAKASGGYTKEAMLKPGVLDQMVKNAENDDELRKIARAVEKHGLSMPQQLSDVSTGRMGRKAGGRAKGKTNIVIAINPGAGQQPMMQPGGGAMPPRPAMPVPVAPPAPPPGMGAAPMPMPVPMPVPAPSAGPAPMPGGMPPMARAKGGRIYPKMRAGAGSGEGRLQKIDEYGLTPPRRI